MTFTANELIVFQILARRLREHREVTPMQLADLIELAIEEAKGGE